MRISLTNNFNLVNSARSDKKTVCNNPKTISKAQKLIYPKYSTLMAYSSICFGSDSIDDLNNFATIEDYRRLKPTQIERLRQSVHEKFRFRPSIFSKPEEMETLEKAAQKIFQEFKNQRLVSLGRSPLVLLETYKSMENGINDYDFVAFSSGGSLSSINSRIWSSSQRNPEKKELNCYREYLETIDMSPKKIIQIAKNGNKTVIVDFCDSAGGMKAFLEILRDWALEQENYEELKKSVMAIPMIYPDRSNPTYMFKENEYIINGKKQSMNMLKEFNAKLIDLQDHDKFRLFLDAFFVDPANASFEKPYPAKLWTKKPERGPQIGYEYISNLAKFAIYDYLAKRKLLK